MSRGGRRKDSAHEHDARRREAHRHGRSHAAAAGRAAGGALSDDAACTGLITNNAARNVQRAAAWNADGGISRNDMIDILESADIDGSVSNQALAGLQALTQPGAASLLNEPDDVAVLAADVVQGNQANADYQGQPLGNLASQPTGEAMAACLTDLVQKWFEGSDLPAAAARTPPPPVRFTARQAGRRSADMPRAAVGDCYFIAAMGSIADTDPQAVESMFIDNGDGT